MAGGPLTRLDTHVLAAVGPVEAGWPTDVAALLADAGHWPVQGGFLLALAGAAALVRRSPRPVLIAAVGLALVGILGSLTKVLLARTAPWSGTDEVFADGSAYPSGHAAGAVVVGLLAAGLLSSWGGRVVGRLAMLAGIGWATAMGWSRIHLGVHWTTDVLGGWLLGLGAALVAVRCEFLANAWIKPRATRTRGTCPSADTFPASGGSTRRPTGPGGPR